MQLKDSPFTPLSSKLSFSVDPKSSFKSRDSQPGCSSIWSIPTVPLCSDLLRVSSFRHSWDLSATSHAPAYAYLFALKFSNTFQSSQSAVQRERRAGTNRGSQCWPYDAPKRFDLMASLSYEKILATRKILAQTHEPFGREPRRCRTLVRICVLGRARATAPMRGTAIDGRSCTVDS